MQHNKNKNELSLAEVHELLKTSIREDDSFITLEETAQGTMQETTETILENDLSITINDSKDMNMKSYSRKSNKQMKQISCARPRQKNVLGAIENTLYSTAKKPESSIWKNKDEYPKDIENKIKEISEEFRKIEEYQLICEK